MSEAKFKIMRHIETVRNYINAVIKELMWRQEQHDQSKFSSPELEAFEFFTPMLRENMNLIDLIEMLCDWKASSLRHSTGCILKSIEIMQKKLGFSDELAGLFKNTAEWMEKEMVFHAGEES